jgi:hypothetical protein
MLDANHQILEIRLPWFSTTSRQSCRKVTARSVCRIKDKPRRRSGALAMGKNSQLDLNHSLGRIKLLSPLLRIGPFPSPGDGTTVNMGFYRYSKPVRPTSWALRYGSSSMSASGTVRFILASGQSGHLFHPITAIRPRFGAQVVTLESEPSESKAIGKWLFLTPPRSRFLDCHLRKPYKKPSSRTPGLIQAEASMPLKLLIADDERLFRQSLKYCSRPPRT